MWVVKLGGSLYTSDRLRPWLQALALRNDLVVVPGGGPFADQVREAQSRWGFDDATAHHLALLAMEQLGRMLCALEPGLEPAESPDEIRASLHAGRTPVWMPTRMVLSDPRIATGWDVTSDSLAAWLCRRLDADGLALVKARLIEGVSADARTWCDAGIVDRAFPEYVDALRVPIRLLSQMDSGCLATTLAEQASPE